MSKEIHPSDAEQLADKGISIEDFSNYIKNFEEGFPFVHLVNFCSVDYGILKPDENYLNDFVEKYNLSQVDVLKFVPASGAASRMFKNLQAFLNSGSKSDDVIELFKSLNAFAFYPQLQEKLNLTEDDIKKKINSGDYKEITSALLTEDGLNLANKPKGLIPFHKYSNAEYRTAFEEHLAEGALYAEKKGVVNSHFTISPDAKQEIMDHLEESLNKFELIYDKKFSISYSEQKSSTDTPAVSLNNIPLRDMEGRLVFRPGGHGALLENLNDLDADIIFVKNIDNVVPDSLKAMSIKYKKALAGLLLQMQEKIFRFLRELEKEISDARLMEIRNFCKENLFLDINSTSRKEEIIKVLNRPIRVCGMVKNQGEPGGGPFWVKGEEGKVSLQIIETAQIDMDKTDQVEILKNASHFNPVDIVCAVRDYKGNKFNLMEFRNMNTGFIAEKSLNGQAIKALELPGLWNGAMYNWTSIFVEVPVETFNPVKTVNDLLRDAHQA